MRQKIIPYIKQNKRIQRIIKIGIIGIGVYVGLSIWTNQYNNYAYGNKQIQYLGQRKDVSFMTNEDMENIQWKDAMIIEGKEYKINSKKEIYKKIILDEKNENVFIKAYNIFKKTGKKKCFQMEAKVSNKEINDIVKDVAKRCNKKMKEPKIKTKKKRAYAYNGQNGRIVKEKELRKNIIDVCEGRKRNVKVTYQVVENHEKEYKKITKRISTFTTEYGYGGNRGNNIELAAGRVNVILMPGQTFNLNRTIKNRTKENGYDTAPSYNNGQTVQTYGGGVCQVCTTLYNSILRAGIIPKQRNAHSSPVHYIELGLDAALSGDDKNLVFINPYDTPIYIEGTAKYGYLTFSVYGSKDLLEGYKYEPYTISKGSYDAKAYLVKKKKGEKNKTYYLGSSTYQPISDS